MKLINVVSVLLKTQNQQAKSVLLAAKSISALRQQVPIRFWRNEVKHGNLLDKNTTLRLLQSMSDGMPKPTFPTSNQIMIYCVDQVSDQYAVSYLYRHCIDQIVCVDLVPCLAG